MGFKFEPIRSRRPPLHRQHHRLRTHYIAPAPRATHPPMETPEPTQPPSAGSGNRSRSTTKKRRRGHGRSLPFHELCVELRRDGATVDQVGKMHEWQQHTYTHIHTILHRHMYMYIMGPGARAEPAPGRAGLRGGGVERDGGRARGRAAAGARAAEAQGGRRPLAGHAGPSCCRRTAFVLA